MGKYFFLSFDSVISQLQMFMIYFILLGVKNVSAESSCWFIRNGTLYFMRYAKKAEKFNSIASNSRYSKSPKYKSIVL